jgi:phosphatidylserine/phosphatidylglycerophosphate/cardiolipin synthase-like enzyme
MRWYLSCLERGNTATVIDGAHPGRAWSTGNQVTPLIHGARYFAELHHCIERTVRGDLILFTDWRGDPDEQLTADPGSDVGTVLAKAAERGAIVAGLVWRSHLDRFQFSARENRHLGEEIENAGGCCLLDMRVRTFGSHHQKFVVIRHPGRPELDAAFVGGIDLCHSRRDDARHRGDPQTQSMAAVYGAAPPWHDVQLRIAGPAVADVETVFRERWSDPRPLSRNPLRRLTDRLRGDDQHRMQLPAQLPPPQPAGTLPVQLLRTYPRRRPGYPFAPAGERSVARGYLKAIAQAERLIYIEDQYLWSRAVTRCLAAALARNPGLLLIAVLPPYPDQDGRALPPNLVGRNAAVRMLGHVAPDRVGLFGTENADCVPIYVHAKVCIVDDTWATTGSDNFNRRSWTHDSELTVAVCDTDYATELRLTLAGEHLGLPQAQCERLSDPRAAFDAFAAHAHALEQWARGDSACPRPPGQLRPLPEPALPLRTRLWAEPAYRVLYDPDGREVVDRLLDRY